jgi:hypothetical protein
MTSSSTDAGDGKDVDEGEGECQERREEENERRKTKKSQKNPAELKKALRWKTMVGKGGPGKSQGGSGGGRWD